MAEAPSRFTSVADTSRLSLSDASTQHEPGAIDRTCSDKEAKNRAIPDEKDIEAVEAAGDHDRPPDGGTQAWLQVFASYFLFFNTWGIVNAFGAFQTFYDATLPKSPSDVSWIGTFQGFLLLFVGAVAGPAYDKGYLRELLAIGSFLLVLGLMMTSISTQYYQIFLAQGVALGLGCGFLVIPAMAVVAQYFHRRRAVAMGIVASGGSMGSIVYPIIFKRLQVEMSFAWATRIMGFIALGTLLVSNIFMRSRLPPSKTARALVDTSAFRNPQFLTFTLALFLYFMGIYLPFFYVSSWAQQKLGTSDELSFYILSVLNAGSLFGRVIPGFLADRFGPINLLTPCIALTGMLSFTWIAVDSFAGLILFCIFYGFFSGASVSLPATIITVITPELDRVGTWMGMAFSLCSLGLLVGNPIAGAILEKSGGSYVGAQCFSASVTMGGFLCLCWLRFLRRKEVDGWKT